jgi:hypothetical protein
MLGYHKAEHGPVRVVMGARSAKHGGWGVTTSSIPRASASASAGPSPRVHRDVEVQVDIQTRVLQTGISCWGRGGASGASAAVRGRYDSGGDTVVFARRTCEPAAAHSQQKHCWIAWLLYSAFGPGPGPGIRRTGRRVQMTECAGAGGIVSERSVSELTSRGVTGEDGCCGGGEGEGVHVHRNRGEDREWG